MSVQGAVSGGQAAGPAHRGAGKPEPIRGTPAAALVVGEATNACVFACCVQNNNKELRGQLDAAHAELQVLRG